MGVQLADVTLGINQASKSIFRNSALLTRFQTDFFVAHELTWLVVGHLDKILSDFGKSSVLQALRWLAGCIVVESRPLLYILINLAEMQMT